MVSWVESKTKKWVLEKIGYVFDVENTMAERKIRLFGLIGRNSMENKLIQEKMDYGRPAPKGQTCKYLVPGFEGKDKAGRGGRIPNRD